MNKNTVTNQTKSRVLFVSHDGGMAGAQKTLLTLLATIDRNRYEPFLIVPDGGQFSQEAENLRIPVFVRQLVHWVPGVSSVPKQRRFHHLIKVLKTLRARSWAIAHLIERNQIDLVYTNTVTCIEGAVAARMTHTPHVWHIHESILGNSELTPILPLHLYHWVINKLSNSVVFCSAILARSYPSLSKKAHIVYNGLTLPTLPDRLFAREAISRLLGVNNKKKIVAIIGMLHPRKDHFTFLAAAEKVLQEWTNVVFLIVGDGPESYKKSIMERIESLNLSTFVRLTGWWPNEEIFKLLAGTDILTVCSEQESFGLTIIEALAMKTPVVSTRCGGPEEIIADGKTGYLVPVRDSAAIAEAICHLLQHPKKAQTFGEMGRQEILNRFSVESYRDGLQKVIEKSLIH